jgi:hypothetical protein
MSYTFNLNAPAFTAILSDIGNQARFAVVQALTATAKDIQAAERDGLEQSLDRPTPFTLNAFGVEPATKAKPTARVFMRPIQSRYLQWQIEGGQRSYKGFELKIRDKTFNAFLIPGLDTPLDQYGNLSRADIIKITAELNSSGGAKRYFAGQPKGRPDLPSGVYARVNNNTSIEPLLVFATSAVYTKRFEWSAIATRTIDARFEQNLIAAIANTRATAR